MRAIPRDRSEGAAWRLVGLMGRREDREALQSTWTTLEPRVPGTPFTKKDIEDNEERERLPPPSPVTADDARRAVRKLVRG